MRLLFLLLLGFSVTGFAQIDFLEGDWQGVLTDLNQPNKKGTAIWFNFSIDNSGKLKGESRLETPFTKFYAYKNIKGNATKNKTLSFEDILIGKQKNGGGKVWCLNKGELTYNDSTGYLKGTWISKDCRGRSGELILYRSKYEMSRSDTLSLYHSWFNNLVNDLERGWNAYYVREAEMRNFEFVPVYFEHDKDLLRSEFNAYLKRMAEIVNSHSDLRIKIIGHTDSNGSDVYNINLSERRAKNVKTFLVGLGISEDKVVIEYRGENDPAMSNETSDGKRLNRRVDFEFI